MTMYVKVERKMIVVVCVQMLFNNDKTFCKQFVCLTEKCNIEYGLLLGKHNSKWCCDTFVILSTPK